MMLSYLKKLFGFKSTEAQAEVPYKVEAPVAPTPKTCGCGRSTSGLCEGLHNLSEEEWAKRSAPAAAEAPAKQAAKKKPAARTAAKKKPATKKAVDKQ